MENILTESTSFIISNEYEVTFLTFKNTQRTVIIGDFYGDPSVAYISKDESFCVVGGCGLIIYFLKEPFLEYEYNKVPDQWKELFRNNDDIWWVEQISEGKKETSIRFIIDPTAEKHLGTYELDTETLKLSKIE